MASNDNQMTTLPDAALLLRTADGALTVAKQFVIDSPDMFEIAAGELREIKAKAAAMEEQRLGITRPMDAAKKKVMDLFRLPLERLTQVEGVYKAAMLAYRRVEDAKAAELQRIANAEARAEKQRLEAIAREQAAAAQKLQAEASELAGIGDAEGAAQVSAQAETAQINATMTETTALVVSAPVMESAAKKVSGIRYTGVWKARVTDKAALLAHIVANPELLEWADINMSPLTQMAKALKTAMKIPGVEAFEEAGISARS